jgi:hypothetical protein
VVVTCIANGDGDLARYVITSTACNMPTAGGDCVNVNKAESVQRKLEAEL